jgi:hypothetical protein
MGFWDVVKENPNGTFVLACLGLVTIKQCWDRWCFYRSTLEIAEKKIRLEMAKLEKKEINESGEVRDIDTD